MRVGDAVEVGERESGVREHPPGQRNDAAHVVARRELRHDAAVGFVHRHLRVQRVGDEAAARVVDREAGFVAGGFDAEDAHADRRGSAPLRCREQGIWGRNRGPAPISGARATLGVAARLGFGRFSPGAYSGSIDGPPMTVMGGSSSAPIAKSMIRRALTTWTPRPDGLTGNLSRRAKMIGRE